MSFIKDLHPASFRGIPFLVKSETVTRGKKVVMHEYPNSDERYVEELGKIPPVFTIPAIVHGEDYINKRLELEEALERPGQGLLIHPIYGRINVVATSFSVSSDQTEIGQFLFDITFAKSRENITPSPSSPTAASVSKLRKDTLEKLDARLGQIYNAPTKISAFDSAINTINGAFGEVKSQIQKVTDLSTKGAANFDRVYRSITRNISSIVSSAQTIRDNVTLFYTAALDAPVLIEQLAAAWENLIKYPLTIPLSRPSTRDKQESEQNRIAIIEHLKLTALAASFEAEVYRNFVTDDELAETRAGLNDSYDDQLKRNNEYISDIGLISIANDPDIRSSFATLRINSRKVFDEKRKAVFRVTNINPGMSSMALTTFRYYGGIDLIDEMIELNESVNACNFNEQIKALT